VALPEPDNARAEQDVFLMLTRGSDAVPRLKVIAQEIESAKTYLARNLD
jgi:hypothetical protein